MCFVVGYSFCYCCSLRFFMVWCAATEVQEIHGQNIIIQNNNIDPAMNARRATKQQQHHITERRKKSMCIHQFVYFLFECNLY